MALTTQRVRDPFFFNVAAMEQAATEQRFDELFGRMLGHDGAITRPYIPWVDVLETGDQYLVLVDLPGVDEDKIVCEWKDGILTVSGKRTRPECDEARRLERPIGEFVRSIELPHGLGAGKMEAEYRDGVLELRVPKPADVKPERITLKHPVGA